MDYISVHILTTLQFSTCPNSKFYFAFTLQLAIGILFLLAIFILIVQSTEVVGMFLNYAALQFITEVDDIAFKLAALGYVGKSMKKENIDQQMTHKLIWNLSENSSATKKSNAKIMYKKT